MPRTPLTLLLAGAALLVACNPYDPSLGDTPFRCGTDEPRCPDGYTCVMYSPSDMFCEESAGPVPDGGGGGDSGLLDCTGDMEIEPNETIGDAHPTGIPDFGGDYNLLGVLICPEVDVDVFFFRIDVTGKNGRVEINYDETRGQLLVDMLNSAGVSIRTGVPVGGDSGKLRADVANMAAGTYYAQIKGMNGTTAEYSLSILTTTAPLPP